VKLRLLDAIEQTHNTRVVPPYKRIKVDFNVEPSDQLNFMPDWRRFRTMVTIGCVNNAPLEAADEVLRMSRSMIVDEVYGEVYRELYKIRVEMYEQGVGMYGEDKKIVDMLDELMGALRA
jgi:hypothetical protein